MIFLTSNRSIFTNSCFRTKISHQNLSNLSLTKRNHVRDHKMRINQFMRTFVHDSRQVNNLMGLHVGNRFMMKNLAAISSSSRTVSPFLINRISSSQSTSQQTLRNSSSLCFHHFAVMRRQMSSTIANHNDHSTSRIVSRPTVFLHSCNVYKNPGSIKKKKRRFGKHGRGNKGYKARSGKSRPVPGFEGGQTGILKASPKFGRSYKHMKLYTTIYMDQLQYWIDSGKLDPSKKITVKTLFDAGLIRYNYLSKDGVELEERGSEFFAHKIDIEVQRTNMECIKKIEQHGGTIKSVYYHREDLGALLLPENHIVRPSKFLLPSRKEDIEYYTHPEFRGYLSNASPEQIEEIRNKLSISP